MNHIIKAHKTEAMKSKKGSMFESSSLPKSVKLKLKGGGYVDPDSGILLMTRGLWIQ